jgi:uncharacterized protein YndB with AHSA1/START domain
MLKITKTIKINAAPGRVFSALTSSDEITKFYPLTEVTSTWQRGSEVLYKGEVNGVPFTDFGVIDTFEPAKAYSYRYWSDNHGTQRSEANQLMVSYVFSASGNGSELTVVQSNIQTQELYELMNTQVWKYLLGSLKNYVETHP